MKRELKSSYCFVMNVNWIQIIYSYVKLDYK